MPCALVRLKNLWHKGFFQKHGKDPTLQFRPQKNTPEISESGRVGRAIDLSARFCYARQVLNPRYTHAFPQNVWGMKQGNSMGSGTKGYEGIDPTQR